MQTIFFLDRKLNLQSHHPETIHPSVPILDVTSDADRLAAFLYDFASSKEPEAFLIAPSVNETIDQLSNHFNILNAAGGIVRNPKNDLLVIFRLGKWDLPKGKCEKGEAPEETALREVREECGIHSIRITDPVPRLTYHAYPLNGEWILKRTFWYRMLFEGNEIPKPQIEEHITDLRWVETNQLDTIIANTYPSLIELFNF